MGDKNDPKNVGKWGRLFQLRNVPVHATLLPDGTVLHWGRRKNPKEDPRKDLKANPPFNNMDEHETKSFLWIPPADGAQPDDSTEAKQGEAIKDENQPTFMNPDTKKQETVSLFCSGHCLMPDGNLLVTGGHLSDGLGVNQACIFDRKNKKWIPQPPMHNGRWYPSVLSMPDGRILCMSGSYQSEYNVNGSIPQLFSPDTSTSSSTADLKPGNWTEVKDSVGIALPFPQKVDPDAGPDQPTPEKTFIQPLYPRLHVDPTNGQIFVTGPTRDSMYLQVKADANAQGADIRDSQGFVGSWKSADTARPGGFRDYAPSIMYAPGKILYTGGGTENGPAGITTAFIDLTQKPLDWDRIRKVKMNNPRRQFNGTILPTGQVLITGGSRGGGFNNLKDVVKTAELMDPEAQNLEWKEMAAEVNSRCYHSIALLLPDGRVLSAGGGEWADPTCKADECHTDGQLFEPPYMFIEGPRPTITTKPGEINVGYNNDFSIDVGSKDMKIGAVNMVKLGSITHCCNFGQHFVPLVIKQQEGTKVSLKGPKDPNYAPPGHYMLFALNQAKKPSVGVIVRIAPLPSQNTPVLPVQVNKGAPQTFMMQKRIQPTLEEHDERIKAEQDHPQVKVGITPLCPYGLGPCWAGAHEGLQAVSDIDVVRPVPNNIDCLAYVYLKPDTLPDLEVWREEFQKVANQNYIMRGIDMTLSGVVAKGKSGADELVLNAKGNRPEVTLRPFKQASQLRWNIQEKAAKPITDEEAGMYKKLVGAWVDRPAGVNAEIKGTLLKQGNGKFTLDVRTFKTLSH